MLALDKLLVSSIIRTYVQSPISYGATIPVTRPATDRRRGGQPGNTPRRITCLIAAAGRRRRLEPRLFTILEDIRSICAIGGADASNLIRSSFDPPPIFAVPGVIYL